MYAQAVLPEKYSQEVRTIELPTGTLMLEVHSSQIPLDDLTAFAARHNPKRGFLFASKVLGKHISARPRAIRDIHTRLAAQIPELPGPILFIGMAETAIALGNGVFDQYVRRTGRRDVVFLHSTRYLLDQMIAFRFEEEHSHAADHFIYMPQNLALQALLKSARSIVLVDDEASTGKTFYNLLKAITDVMPGIKQAATVVITDWRGLHKTGIKPDYMPIPTQPVAILKGHYSFTAAPDLVKIPMPPAVGNGDNKSHLFQAHHGRLGLGVGTDTGQRDRNGWTAIGERIANSGGKNERNRVLVLGTGEFAYPPFLLAEHLEQMGLDVRYQSTTRSPIMPGLAIQERLVFQDNYEDGILNYLYNVRRDDYEHIIIGHETPSQTIDTVLAQALDATTLRFR